MGNAYVADGQRDNNEQDPYTDDELWKLYEDDADVQEPYAPKVSCFQIILVVTRR